MTTCLARFTSHWDCSIQPMRCHYSCTPMKAIVSRGCTLVTIWSGSRHRHEPCYVTQSPDSSADLFRIDVLLLSVHRREERRFGDGHRGQFSTERNACGTMDTGDKRRYDTLVCLCRPIVDALVGPNRTTVDLIPGTKTELRL